MNKRSLTFAYNCFETEISLINSDLLWFSCVDSTTALASCNGGSCSRFSTALETHVPLGFALPLASRSDSVYGTRTAACTIDPQRPAHMVRPLRADDDVDQSSGNEKKQNEACARKAMPETRHTQHATPETSADRLLSYTTISEYRHVTHLRISCLRFLSSPRQPPPIGMHVHSPICSPTATRTSDPHSTILRVKHTA